MVKICHYPFSPQKILYIGIIFNLKAMINYCTFGLFSYLNSVKTLFSVIFGSFPLRYKKMIEKIEKNVQLLTSFMYQLV